MWLLIDPQQRDQTSLSLINTDQISAFDPVPTGPEHPRTIKARQKGCVAVVYAILPSGELLCVYDKDDFATMNKAMDACNYWIGRMFMIINEIGNESSGFIPYLPNRADPPKEAKTNGP